MKQNIILPLNSKYVLIHRHTRIHTYIHIENTEMMQVQIPSVDAVGAAADTLPFTLIFRSIFFWLFVLFLENKENICEGKTVNDKGERDRTTAKQKQSDIVKIFLNYHNYR